MTDNAEYDCEIKETQEKILDCRRQLTALEQHLSELLVKQDKLKMSINNHIINDEGTRKSQSFNSYQKRHLPMVPVRRMSESDPSPEQFLPRSTTSSFVCKSSGNSPLLNRRPVSCSLEDISRVGQKDSNTSSSMKKGKKFSTIDLRFLKKIRNYTRSPTSWDSNLSQPKLSISSMDEVMSESLNSLTYSNDDLDKSVEVSDVGLFKSSTFVIQINTSYFLLFFN